MHHTCSRSLTERNWGRDIEVTKGIEMGADAYVTKPFSTRELAARVREMLDE